MDAQNTIEPDAFYGARLKVKRAYKHIVELEEWLDCIIKENVDATSAHRDRNPEHPRMPVFILRPQEYFEVLYTAIGDAIHNLRTALDFAASAVVFSGGKDDPTKSYFPMQNTRDSLIRSREYGMIERVIPELALKIADVIKPYKTGGDGRFWALNQLDRMDKHRLLVPIFAQSSIHNVAICDIHEDDPPPAPPGSTYVICQVIRDGIVIQESREPRPGTKAYEHNQNNSYVAVMILFPKGEIFENEPVIPTLRQLAQLVAGVIDIFEATCLGRDTA